MHASCLCLASVSRTLCFAFAAAALPHAAHAATPCAAAWSAATAYTGGQSASLNGENYTANWWTQGQSPAANSGATGSGQPWTAAGACSGSSSGGGTTTPPVSSGPAPSSTGKLFAPYVDMSITADQNIVAMQQQAGFNAVTLAFLDQTNGCAVGWGGLGGSLPTDNFANGTTILSAVQSLQAAGVQVIVSFGGANGQEVALGCTSASQLQAVYQSVLDRYKVTMLDFDLETSGELTNQASITMRDQALVGLKAANPGLVVSYTLPVLPTGLVSTGINLLTSAKADGVPLNLVNIMAMDFGSQFDTNVNMGLDATDAAAAVEQQLVTAGLTSTKVGVTPMIGLNDDANETFSIADANTLLNFANSTGYIARLSMWSLGRDNGGCPGQGYASPSCSGLSQSAYQFTSNFKTY